MPKKTQKIINEKKEGKHHTHIKIIMKQINKYIYKRAIILNQATRDIIIIIT
jgi:hypothetical protein